MPSPPAFHAVAGGGALQEIVDLAVGVHGGGLVGFLALVRQQQVVAVHRGGDRGDVTTGHHELQDGHLGGCVLHGHAVGRQGQGRLAAVQELARGIDQVTEEDLLGQGERPAEALADGGQALAGAGVRAADEVGGGRDLHGSLRGCADG